MSNADNKSKQAGRFPEISPRKKYEQSQLSATDDERSDHTMTKNEKYSKYAVITTAHGRAETTSGDVGGNHQHFQYAKHSSIA